MAYSKLPESTKKRMFCLNKLKDKCTSNECNLGM